MTQTALDAGAAAYRPGTSDAEIEAAASRAAAHRQRMVMFWRYAILIVFLGGWEIGARREWIDPFFFAMPTAIAGRLADWAIEGSDGVSLWYHLWVTMEESLIGFFTGSVAGVVIGIALGRNRMAADVFSIYIKVINSIPRVVLAPIFIMLFGPGHSPLRARASRLRCRRRRRRGFRLSAARYFCRADGGVRRRRRGSRSAPRASTASRSGPPGAISPGGSRSASSDIPPPARRS